MAIELNRVLFDIYIYIYIYMYIYIYISLLSTFNHIEHDDDDNNNNPLNFQHSDDPNIRHAMRKDDGTVEVRAGRDLKAGEELFNQYRPEEEETMPYHRFFSRYGFVPGISDDTIVSLLEDKSSIFFAQTAEV